MFSKMRVLLSVIALAAMVTPANAELSVVSLGTSSPPATLGGYTMTAFGADSSPVGSSTTSVASPLGGSLSFSSSLTHDTIGDGWATWGQGYTGSVYSTSASEVTLTVPGSTGAFDFYAEPNVFSTYTVTATATDGTTLTQSVAGDAGAAAWGFYSSPGGPTIASITVSVDPAAGGFAVGEFGIAAQTIAVPEPSTALIAAVGALGWVGVNFMKHRRRRAA